MTLYVVISKMSTSDMNNIQNLQTGIESSAHPTKFIQSRLLTFHANSITSDICHGIACYDAVSLPFKYFHCICLLASIFQINKVALFFDNTDFIIIELVSRLCLRIVFVIGAIPGLNLWSTGICCDTLFQKEKERFVLEILFQPFSTQFEPKTYD